MAETRYFIVDRTPFPATEAHEHPFRTIEAAVENKSNPSASVVAVEDCKVRRLTPEEEMEYKEAISKALRL